jgi:hypothetical protein
VIDGTRCKRVDHDVMEVLREFRDSADARGVAVDIIGLDLGRIGGALAH